MYSRTTIQNEDFVITIMGKHALDNALDWIRSTLSPDDVFTTATLEEWATENGFVENQQ